MVFNDSYYVFLEDIYQKLSLRELVRYRNSQSTRPTVWSARISTGLFGLTNCKSGNRGTKGYAEVLLALGENGLNKLVEQGFIPCPTCHPEKKDGFWNALEDTVNKKYNIRSSEDFINKEILSFDARRIDFEEILPMTAQSPNRLYLPKNLSEKELSEFKSRLDALGVALPPTGYYDANAPGRFARYF
jgi:hypothetical protein